MSRINTFAGSYPLRPNDIASASRRIIQPTRPQRRLISANASKDEELEEMRRYKEKVRLGLEQALQQAAAEAAGKSLCFGQFTHPVFDGGVLILTYQEAIFFILFPFFALVFAAKSPVPDKAEEDLPEINGETFWPIMQENSGHLCVVLCYTNSCIPCAEAKPQLIQWSKDLNGEVKFFKFGLTLPNKKRALEVRMELPEQQTSVSYLYIYIARCSLYLGNMRRLLRFVYNCI